MKISKIAMVSILLLAILTLGAVSASDNTDNLTAIGDTDVSQADGEDIIASSDDSEENVVIGDGPADEREDSNMTVNVDGNAIVNGYIHINTRLPGDASGSVTYTFITDVLNESVVRHVDEDFYYEPYDYDWENDIEYCAYLDNYYYDVNYFGNLEVIVDYSGDDNYLPANQSFSYFFKNTDYIIYFENIDAINYGVSGAIEIFAPYKFNSTLTVTVNGKRYDVKYDANAENSNYYLDASLLRYGENELKISYAGDDVFGKFNGEVKTIKSMAFFNIPEEITYPENCTVSLILPKDAIGNVTVYRYGDYDEDLGEHVRITLANGTVKNGKANISMPNLPVGQYMELYAEYNGNYESLVQSDYVTVNPIINVPRLVFVGDEPLITIEGDSNMEGNFNVDFYNSDNSLVDSYSAEIKDGKGNLTFPDLEVGKYYISWAFNGFYDWISVYVLNSTKIDLDANYYFNALTIGDWDDIYVYYPEYALGSFSLYVDGKYVENSTVDRDIDGSDSEHFIITTNDLDVGNHTFEVRFTSDVFDNASYTDNFEVDNIIVRIPESVDLNYDEFFDSYSVVVDLSENMTGTVTLFLDDVEFEKKVIKEGWRRCRFSLRNIPVKDYDVKIVYSGDDKYPEVIRTGKTHLFYRIYVSDETRYGYNDSAIYVGGPFYQVYGGKLIVIIDGKVYYDDAVEHYSAWIKVPDLSYGKHNVTAKYTGDPIYTPLEVNKTIDVKSYIHIPGHWSIDEDVNLILPSDAKGDLCVNISRYESGEDYEEYLVPCDYKEIPLVNGKASLSLDDLEYGNYYIVAHYSGSDYNVSSTDQDFRMGPVIDFDDNETLNGLNTISIESPISEGEFIVSLKRVRGYDYDREPIYSEIFTKTIPLVNNKASHTFKFELLGDYEISAKYVVDGMVLREYDDYLGVSPNYISFPYQFYENDSENIVVEMPKDTIGNASVSISHYVDEDLVYVGAADASFEGGVAIVKLPILPADDYSFTINVASNKGNYTREWWCYVEPQTGLRDANLNAIASNINVGEVAKVVISINEEVTGALTVDGKAIDTIHGVVSYEIADLEVGMHSVNIKFAGDDKFNAAEKTVSFKVSEYQAPANGTNNSGGNKTDDNPSSGNGTGNNPTDGNKTDDNPSSGNGTGNNPTDGNKTDDNPSSGNASDAKLKPELTVSVSDIKVGDVAKVVISINKNITGALTVDGKTVNVINGTASYDISGLNAGDHSVNVKFAGDDKFDADEKTVSFKVNKIESAPGSNPFNFDENKPVESKTPIYSIQLEKDATGNLTVTVGDKSYTQPLVNGAASIEITDLPAGSYDVTVAYSGDDKYAASVKTSKATVKVDPKIVADDLSVQYNAGKYYSVTVYGDDGKAAVGVEVIFTLNGKQIAKAITNEDGVAKFKVKQTPVTKGKIVSSALGVNATKELTVEQILTLKKVTVKKSAKKLVLQATLKKVNGKYLKGKKITFKFNGKKYTTKTDKKGVAKVTVKSSVLKKLKAGKKVTYTATYVKDTVKRSVKVKK